MYVTSTAAYSHHHYLIGHYLINLNTVKGRTQRDGACRRNKNNNFVHKVIWNVVHNLRSSRNQLVLGLWGGGLGCPKCNYEKTTKTWLIFVAVTRLCFSDTSHRHALDLSFQEQRKEERAHPSKGQVGAATRPPDPNLKSPDFANTMVVNLYVIYPSAKTDNWHTRSVTFLVLNYSSDQITRTSDPDTVHRSR